MGIVDDDIARVREATDIAAVIGEHIGLKRVGRRLVGVCPFHAEKTPSFSVNPELGLYHCFGCQASGDAITFLREIEHLDFVEAVERLATRAGVQLRYDERGKSEGREKRGRLVEAMEAAVDFYHRRLLEAPDAGAARRYLRSRGFEADAVRQFRLGWAPEGWDELSRHLHQRKFSREEITDAGLAFVNKASRLQDQFRGRVMFPILDPGGDAVAFGGRAFADDAGPKYKNSPEGALYHKSRVLYGLNWAKAEAVAHGELVVCEGYTDVMACHLAGAPRAVATCGTALTEDHVRLMKRFVSRVVLAYDADAAGQAAAEKFYAWEHQYELEVAVAALPEGRDPAEVWADDPDLLVKAIDGARPFLRFRLDRLMERADRSSAEGRARAANGAIDLVAEHPDPLVRDQYVVRLSDELAIDVDRLRESVERARRTRGQPRPVAADDASGPGGGPDLTEVIDRRDLEAVRIAVHHPEFVPDWFDASHLATSVARDAFSALASAATFGDAVEVATEPARALLRRLAVEELPVDEDVESYATDVMVFVVEAAARRYELSLVRQGDDRSIDGKKLLEALHAAMAEDDRETGRKVAEQLVTWVNEGSER
ncbi:MAG TPA: DNA primase [Acidimicrobiia bacterium]|nr:DNA primase [Acidimicrobiia bacterium]